MPVHVHMKKAAATQQVELRPCCVPTPGPARNFNDLDWSGRAWSKQKTIIPAANASLTQLVSSFSTLSTFWWGTKLVLPSWWGITNESFLICSLFSLTKSWQLKKRWHECLLIAMPRSRLQIWASASLPSLFLPPKKTHFFQQPVIGNCEPGHSLASSSSLGSLSFVHKP